MTNTDTPRFFHTDADLAFHGRVAGRDIWSARRSGADGLGWRLVIVRDANETDDTAGPATLPLGVVDPEVAACVRGYEASYADAYTAKVMAMYEDARVQDAGRAYRIRCEANALFNAMQAAVDAYAALESEAA